ncbi:polysaccharide deacetylase family protein [Thalassotalea profundi]|uniref:Polysaccharide deacetylase n=1 Tax=Thalassotalea profundi TaxID=2036687 RepID=A0ABQ3IGB6_9GAMM|nr:polysaccharide deacetylase family protein [Thalassotalea profundi]GHE83511.1 polysaccharide deacetylase [Thalassotalea profundi]
MNKVFCLFLLLFTSIAVNSKEIAITFDDAPLPDSNLYSGEQRTQKLITALKKLNVPDVFFFITTNNITNKTQKRVEAYAEAGFYLGNHSHQHLFPHQKGIETYLQGITEAHKQLSHFDNLVPFYRYPYLDEGKDKKTRDRIRQHLQELNYNNGYVTVDNFDWYMDALLQKALADGNKINYEALKSAYIDILWGSILFYDELAQKSIGRSPKHILLLHENDIAALFVGDLIEHIRMQGWKVISPKDAYEDPIAINVPDVLFNGQGRVAAIAKSKGWDEKYLRNQGSNKAYLDKYFDAKNVFEK